MDLGIEGRVALVMGASKGIGNAIGVALAREGARVALASRDPERIAAAADEIGSGAVGIAADTADLERLSRLPADAAERLGGPVEILITNTGGPPLGQALDADLDAWRQAYEHLVLAPRVLIEAALPAMRERGWGRIVNVGSSSTEEPIPGLTLSNAHRRATVGFLKTLAGEVAGDGVTVNDVATGRFATDRLRENWGGRGGDAHGRDRGPAGRAARRAGRVRRPGRVPVLGARRLRHRRLDPDRRRPAALGLAGGGGALEARGRRASHVLGRPEPVATRRSREPHSARDDHRDAKHLRLGEAERDVVVAADELDQEALGAGEDEVEAKSRPGRNRSRRRQSV